MFVWNDWFSVTAFSFIDLAVFVVCFPLTAAFYLIHRRLGRRLVDLIFANCLLFVTITAFGFFTQDNTVSPLIALRWARINYVMAGLFSASLLHFTHEFVNERSRRFKIVIVAVYITNGLISAAGFTPYFFRMRKQVVEERSWTNVSPGFPEFGEPQMVGAAFFLGVTIFALIILHSAIHSGKIDSRLVPRAKLVLVGVWALVACYAGDHILYATTNVCTVSITLLGFLAFCFSAAFVLGEQVVQTKRLKEALSKYVSPFVADEIISKGLIFENREREVTVLFCDIRGFTHLAQKMDPREVTRFLSRYLNKMTPAVFRHEGMLIQTFGDGLLAVFGAGNSSQSHEIAAVKTAIEMTVALNEFNHECGSSTGTVQIGIGIHSGQAVIGNVGGDEHVDYRVTGSVVNVASRIENYTKTSGHSILLSRTTYLKIQNDVSAIAAGEVALGPGWSVPVMALTSVNVRPHHGSLLLFEDEAKVIELTPNGQINNQPVT